MRDINTLQTNVFMFCKEWANERKTPIPQKEIIRAMGEQGVKSYTALYAINALLDKGYIRRAYSPKYNVSLYTLIRNI